MHNTQRVALIGDYNSEVIAHQAIPLALEIAANSIQTDLSFDWVNTNALTGDVHKILSDYQKIWCVPASPYENMQGALSAIRYARENSIPFLGTCGGYQHAILEFAHNVLGFTDAENAEVNPDTQFPLINPLSCSLVEKEAEISLIPNTRIHRIYGKSEISEKYHCSYGFNQDYLHLFKNSQLIVSGHDRDSQPRSIELLGHPFFIASAFQPERSALEQQTHPLISALINA